jgi:LacI family transcriptional regulator
LKKITIDDVAKKAGVSKGTVSAVINQKNIVHVETRDAVIRAMKELNYRPRGSAWNLKNPLLQYRSIGLLVCDGSSD